VKCDHSKKILLRLADYETSQLCGLGDNAEKNAVAVEMNSGANSQQPLRIPNEG